MTVGRIVSHFEILERLGAGGMGVVYEARDIKLGRSVALKFLPSHLCTDRLARDRFMQEAKAASALDHPNICTIYEIGESDDAEIFIAMARYQGRTLRELLADGPLPAAKALHIARQIAEGLSAAHGVGIVHRDVKPANIMVADDGLVHILDFGLAKVAEHHLTVTGGTVGTVAYMSPEQARGEVVDRRSDIWSLGCVLYEMLAGMSPFFAGHESAIVYRLLNEDPKPLGDYLPVEYAGLEHLVRRCLAKNPDERYASVAEFQPDLLTILHTVERTGADEHPPVPTKTSLWTRSRPAMLVVAAVLVTLGVFGLGRAGQASDDLSGIAVLPFTAVGVDSVDCAGLGDVLLAPLVEAAGRIRHSVIPQGELLKRGITTAGEAYRIFGTERAIGGHCFAVGGKIEISLTMQDASRAGAVIRMTQLSTTQSDFRALLENGPDAVAALLPGIDGDMIPATIGSSDNPAAIGHYVRARAFMLSDDRESSVDAAIAELQNAIQLDSDFASALEALGEAYVVKHTFHGGDPASLRLAVDYSQRAMAADGRLPSSRLTMARAQMKMGHLDEARAEIDHALALDSTNWKAHHAKATLFVALGDLDTADESFRLAIERMPDYWPLRIEFGVYLLGRGQYDNARDQFDQILRLAPESFSALNAIGAVYYFKDEREAASAYFERSAAINPTRGSLSNVATIQFDLGRYTDAAASYRLLVQREDGAPDHRLWGNLALAESASGRPDSANAAFAVAIGLAQTKLSLRPGDAAVQMDLATYLAHVGAFERALELVEQSLKTSADDGYSVHSAVVVYELAGDRGRALSWIRRALEDGYAIERFESDPDLTALRKDPAYTNLKTGDTSAELPSASINPIPK